MSNIRQNDRGMVSILVTMIMILVITLIVIGFTQLTNRNNREALDKQLSTQAFYAAESGVNQAIKTINDAGAGASSLAKQSTCQGTTYGGAPVTLSASPGPEVRVTCLLVDPTGDNIITSANSGASTVVPVNPTKADGSNDSLRTLTFEWSSPDAGVPASAPASCTSEFSSGFPQNITACSYGTLRIDLMQVTGATTAQAAANNTQSYYLKPTAPATINAAGFAAPVAYIGGSTCTTVSCKATINFLSPAPAGTKYYARLSSLYKSAPKVQIDGTLVSTGGSAYFRGIFKIDATGKSEDVLRRVQVRYNPTSMSSDSFAALQTQAGICKRFTVVSDAVVTPDPSCGQ